MSFRISCRYKIHFLDYVSNFELELFWRSSANDSSDEHAPTNIILGSLNLNRLNIYYNYGKLTRSDILRTSTRIDRMVTHLKLRTSSHSPTVARDGSSFILRCFIAFWNDISCFSSLLEGYPKNPQEPVQPRFQIPRWEVGSIYE